MSTGEAYSKYRHVDIECSPCWKSRLSELFLVLNKKITNQPLYLQYLRKLCSDHPEFQSNPMSSPLGMVRVPTEEMCQADQFTPAILGEVTARIPDRQMKNVLNFHNYFANQYNNAIEASKLAHEFNKEIASYNGADEQKFPLPPAEIYISIPEHLKVIKPMHKPWYHNFLLRYQSKILPEQDVIFEPLLRGGAASPPIKTYCTNINYSNLQGMNTLSAWVHYVYSKSNKQLLISGLKGQCVYLVKKEEEGKSPSQNSRRCYILFSPTPQTVDEFQYGEKVAQGKAQVTDWGPVSEFSFFELHRCTALCKHLNIDQDRPDEVVLNRWKSQNKALHDRAGKEKTNDLLCDSTDLSFYQRPTTAVRYQGNHPTCWAMAIARSVRRTLTQSDDASSWKGFDQLYNTLVKEWGDTEGQFVNHVLQTDSHIQKEYGLAFERLKSKQEAISIAHPKAGVFRAPVMSTSLTDCEKDVFHNITGQVGVLQKEMFRKCHQDKKQHLLDQKNIKTGHAMTVTNVFGGGNGKCSRLKKRSGEDLQGATVEITNSWGKNWGANGKFTILYDDLEVLRPVFYDIYKPEK